jgi:CubicO group peptidase (beta-lactamase class C family)
VSATDPVDGWALVTPSGVQAHGITDAVVPWASVTKVLFSVAAWVAVEEGTLDLDAPAGPPGSTLRHLLAHASGLAYEGDAVLARPGTRRIYSNTGIEVAADVLEAAAGMPWSDYVVEAVCRPLGMTRTVVGGSAAAGVTGPLDDLVLLAAELLSPTLVAGSTWAEATAVVFPGLPGVLPGFGRQASNDWGLAVEVRGHKSPHWTPPEASPATFGHFGRAGGFVWVDPVAGLACASLTARPFGPWAAEAWPVIGSLAFRSRG